MGGAGGGGDSGEGVTCASVWAQDFERWDIVSYNFGAWDIDGSDGNLTKNATGTPILTPWTGF